MLREKFGELFSFLLRKSFTCRRTSQLQGKVVPTTADEGVAVFEFIEEVGYYDPTKEPSVIKVDEEKAKKWISTGAQPTDTVKSLLKIAGVL